MITITIKENSMRHALILIFLIFCNFAFATPEIFKGKWQGQGTYILSGDMTKCANVELQFGATTNQFQFIGGQRNCDKHDEQFYPAYMSYKNGEIFFNGLKVGTYTSSTMEVRYRMADGKTFRNWRMFMRREGNHLMYEESRTMDGETTPLISFAGLLIIQP